MNRQEHALTGAFAACIISALLLWARRLDFFFFWFYIGLAVVAAILPDVLEPALDWQHRRYFHSWNFCGIMAGAALIGLVIGWHTGYFFLFFFALGYVSHLLGDATTKVGLPRM
jgi:membrane-bound metal-dependent hydrolase YbcI (DUF457 family)